MSVFTSLTKKISAALVAAALAWVPAARSDGIWNPGGAGGSSSSSGLTLANANQTWQISSSGSDSSPCTVSLPCATLPHVLALAAGFNWNNLYFPTINISNGTYTGVQAALPALLNLKALSCGTIVGNAGSPSSVVLTDSGSAPVITAAQNSRWCVSGVKTTGTYGGYLLDNGAVVTAAKTDLGGNNSHSLIDQLAGFSSFFAASTTVNISATAASDFVSLRGINVMDGSTVTFANAVTFTHSVVNQDDTMSFFAFVGDGVNPASFVNAGNVTVTAGQNALIVKNGAFFEGTPANSSSSNVDGAALNRGNFPGAGANTRAFIDQWSKFQPDILVNFTQPTTGSTVVNDPGAKSVVLGQNSALASLSVTLPPYPSDGDLFAVYTQTAITSFTVNSSDGSSVFNIPSSMNATQAFTLQYNLQFNFWRAVSASAGQGLNCSGTPTSSFATVNGVVTHC
jgi:hypothetical protein